VDLIRHASSLMMHAVSLRDPGLGILEIIQATMAARCELLPPESDIIRHQTSYSRAGRVADRADGGSSVGRWKAEGGKPTAVVVAVKGSVHKHTCRAQSRRCRCRLTFLVYADICCRSP
jgi:hypothetical protein